ncbi:MAG: T9SS type A sorting domain-containing protein, partial [Bacteroidota bacterium]
PGATYSWSFGPGAVPATANTPTVTVSWPTMGVRTIEVQVENADCTGSNILQVFVTNSPIHCLAAPSAPVTGTSDLNAPIEMTAAPNPFQEVVQLRLNRVLETEAQVMVTNLAGQVIHLQAVAPGISELPIDFRGQQSGVYFLQVRLADGTILRERVVKQ